MKGLTPGPLPDPLLEKKGRAIFRPCPRCWVNNAYFLNLFLIAARPARPGPKSRRAPGMGTGIEG